MEKPHAFLALDALRGVAAIAVMAFHIPRFLGVALFPHGYLAVDFFFMLSGFVLTFAYQGKLDRGWSTGQFLKTRLARLYPLYLLGLLLGFVFSMLQTVFGHVHLPAGSTLLLLLLGLLLLPTPTAVHGAGTHLFAYNVPSWSLFFELLANLFHGLWLRRMGARLLAATLAVSGAALIYSVHAMGRLDLGEQRNQLLYGIPRVLFSYTAGVLLFRLWKTEKVRITISPMVAGLLLLLALAAPISHGVGVAVYDLAMVFLFFPMLLLAGACSQPAPRWVKLMQLLGTSSYALYVLHAPVSQFVEQIWGHVLRHSIASYRPWPGVLDMLLSIALALAIDKVYDLPVRTWLRERLVVSRVRSAGGREELRAAPGGFEPTASE